MSRFLQRIVFSFVSLMPAINLAVAQQGPRRCVAFVVGIEAYDENELNRLKYASEDAYRFWNRLAAITKLDRDRSVLLVADRAPHADLPDPAGFIAVDKGENGRFPRISRNSLRNRLEVFLRTVRNDELVVIYFGGHGLVGKDVNAGVYFLPSDFKWINARPANAFRMKEALDLIRIELNNQPRTDVVFFANMCHAGDVVSPGTQNLAEPLDTDLLGKANEKDTPTQQTRIAYFPACAGTEQAFEREELKGSEFTYAVLKGLAGGAVGGQSREITTGSLMSFVQTKVPNIPELPGFPREIVLGRVIDSEIDEASTDLDKTLKNLPTVGNMLEKTALLNEKLTNVEEKIISAYESGKENEDYKELAGRRYSELQRSKPKAVYRTPDLYRPIHYQRIYQSTLSSIALYSNREDKVIGSGVLIGNDLVITCEHNISDERLDNIKVEDDIVVRFDYEDAFDMKQEPVDYEVAKVLFRGIPSPKCKTALDFAVLQLKPKTIDGKLQNASARFPKAKLATTKKLPNHRDPVYVVGHPNGAFRTVHDNAFVLFPFQVETRIYEKLELEVRKEFDYQIYKIEGEKRYGWEVAAKQLRSERDESLKEFATAYISLGEDNSQKQLFHPRAQHLPTIAADCDTSEGNSGSGVWGRRNHLLIGILFYGSAEQHILLESGWRRHEMILPITEIVQQLDADSELGPNWRAKHGVEFE